MTLARLEVLLIPHAEAQGSQRKKWFCEDLLLQFEGLKGKRSGRGRL